MQPANNLCKGVGLQRALGLLCQPGGQAHSGLQGLFSCLSRAPVLAYEMIYSGASSRLSSFAQPQPRQKGAIVRTPNTRHEDRALRYIQRAGGRAEDISQSLLDRAVEAFCPKCPECACMRIDEAYCYRSAFVQAKIPRRRLAQPTGNRAARRADIVANSFKVFICQPAEPDLPEVPGVPSIFMGQIGPLAGDRTARPPCTPGRSPGQEIREVEEIPGFVEGPRKLFSKPEQFRCLHLWRNAPADILEYRCRGGVDPPCLIGRTVVHPHDDVARIVAFSID